MDLLIIFFDLFTYMPVTNVDVNINIKGIQVPRRLVNISKLR